MSSKRTNRVGEVRAASPEDSPEPDARRKDNEHEARPAEQADAQPAAGGDAATLAAQLEEANERHLRLAADFENFKKRARQERIELLQYASATLAERILPVLDDFERVLAHAPEDVDENWLKGIEMTVAKLSETLSSVGVETIEAKGVPFDPKLHEAIGTDESDEHPEDTVLDEVRRGYRMHERVLRPALVRVSRAPARER
ncbi:MAG: nucleotide exchange factor GrpE [bacterium]|jgi:molecular chaperone GrpE|nr:nucleotide exchange factor GrpE [bacterium]